MMSALRWWLLTLGVLFIVGRELWELRRPRQARVRSSGHGSAVPEGAEGARLREATEPARLREPPEPPAPRAPPGEEPMLRQSPLELPEIYARDPIGVRRPPLIELTEDVPVLPAEPAEDADGAQGPPAVDADREEAGAAANDDDIPQDPADIAPAPAPERSWLREALPELPAGPPPVVEWPPDDRRRVVALRLVPTHAERFGGRSLRQALAAEGFVLGRFAIFHKPDEEHRAVLSAASLTRPGTFDPETMDSQHYGGLSLFAVLPGPKTPPEAFEELVTTARSLNERLCGVLQDEGGTPLTPARIATLRERVSAGASS
jgi:FtsZ-interacting cell division protein ZipA